MDWNEKQRIDKLARDAVDSSWHYSWHWQRDEHGYLTLEGWRKVLADGRSLRASLIKRIHAIEELLPRVEEIIAYEEELERDEL